MTNSIGGNHGQSGNRGVHARQEADTQRGNAEKFNQAMREGKGSQVSDDGSRAANNGNGGGRSERGLDHPSMKLNHGRQVAFQNRPDHANGNARGLQVVAMYEQAKTELADGLTQLENLAENSEKADSKLESAKDMLDIAKTAVADAESAKEAAESALQGAMDAAAEADESLPESIGDDFEPTQLQQGVLDGQAELDTALEQLASVTVDMDTATANYENKLQGSDDAKQEIATVQSDLEQTLTHLDEFEGGDSAAVILDSQLATLQLSEAAVAHLRSLQDSLNAN